MANCIRYYCSCLCFIYSFSCLVLMTRYCNARIYVVVLFNCLLVCFVFVCRMNYMKQNDS